MTLDVRKVKYPPESLIEAQVTTTVATGGTVISSYLVDPFDVVLEQLAIQSSEMDVRVSADGFPEKVLVRGDAVIPLDHLRLKVTAMNNIAVQATSQCGAALTNQFSRWNMTVRRPSTIDRLRQGSLLTGEEVKRDEMLALSDRLFLGTAPRHNHLLGDEVFKEFDEIIPITRAITPAAASTITNGTANLIGQTISFPKYSQVGVLLGVWIDHAALHGLTGNDTFITVNRDQDYNYLHMDVNALPRNHLVRCYVPFIDELSVYFESTTGSSGHIVGVGFLYGVRDMSVIDHIRWNIPYKSNNEEADASTILSMNKDDRIEDKIIAGLVS